MEKMVSGMGRLKLNPNAEEFVPAALLKSSNRATAKTEPPQSDIDKKATQSRAANKTDSDDERWQYWKDQLPDDIIPDYSADFEENDDWLPWQHEYDEDSGGITSNDDLQTGINEAFDPLEQLIMQFPGFAAESLADVLAANNGDFYLTLEMLTQLELQDDLVPRRHSQPQEQTHSAMQNINLGDFPALVNSATQSDVDDIQPQKSIGVEDLFSIKPYTAGGGHRNTTATDFATIVRKNTSSTPTSKGEQNRTVRSERSSCYGDYPTKSAEKFGGSNPTRARHSAPVWLETGEAVSNMYADHREEARNHARIRNAYFEQARQAYLSGNKALARELSAEGQKHNDRMKEAHNRACEAIFQQRNMSVGSYDNGQSPILDLHGLHVSEAIPLLKRELAAFRAIARSSHQRLQVLICVGTGHHTKGAKTPARLPVAVEKFLTEDVRLSYTEQKPGMLMVVLS